MFKNQKKIYNLCLKMMHLWCEIKSWMELFNNKEIECTNFAIFFVANFPSKTLKKLTRVSYDQNYYHEFCKILNPSMAHFSTRNIAGILRAFWAQAKKASRIEPIHYFEKLNFLHTLG